MGNRWMRNLVVFALAAGVAAACSKKKEAAPGAPAPDGAAAQADAPPPPPPPPDLTDATVEIDGWKIALGVPEDFAQEEGGAGVFRQKEGRAGGSQITVGPACDDPCVPGAWTERAERIMFRAVSAYEIEDPDGNVIRPEIEFNRKAGVGRYEFEVSVPKGPGILDEPYIAGGTFVFDDAWEKYVACEYFVAIEAGETYHDVLVEACSSVKVVEAPAPAEPAAEAEAGAEGDPESEPEPADPRDEGDRPR